MLELDLALFQALNADAATLPAVVTVARWVSQQLPTATVSYTHLTLPTTPYV